MDTAYSNRSITLSRHIVEHTTELSQISNAAGLDIHYRDEPCDPLLLLQRKRWIKMSTVRIDVVHKLFDVLGEIRSECVRGGLGGEDDDILVVRCVRKTDMTRSKGA